MAKYEIKFMNEAQLAEIDDLLKGEHGDAIRASMLESANAAIEGFSDGIAKGCIHGIVKGTVVGTIGVLLVAAAVDIGTRVYHKLKDKEEPKPWDKPGRDWEV